jgi:hypothetical protein
MEDRHQRSGVRGQRTEDRGRKTDEKRFFTTAALEEQPRGSEGDFERRAMMDER